MVRIALIGVALGASALAAPHSTTTAKHKSSSTTWSATTTSFDSHPSGTTEATLVSSSVSSYGGVAASNYTSPAFVPKHEDLTPKLPQSDTNGNSYWGLLTAPLLVEFLLGSALLDGWPWGSKTVSNTNPYDWNNLPDTGVTRTYDFTITEQTIAPDGVERVGYVVNGQFPGPLIEANWGDWIEVTVTNNLATEGTSLHWHGLLQTETPWFDGVPSVQQCPIAPGQTFTYKFRADLYGTSWWHSHYSAQYASGIFGPMIIYGPHDNADYDVDLGPVMLSDYYHTPYFTLVEQVMAPAAEGAAPPVSNNNLINGKMNYPCANVTIGLNCTPNAGISKFNFTSGLSYRLRVINAGAEGIQKFSIDGYTLKVIANDFVPVVPYETDVLTLGVGQRTDVVVFASGKPTDAVWMRSTLGPSVLATAGACTLNDGVSPEAVAAIYYQDANTTAIPTTNSSIPLSVIMTCANDPLNTTVPAYSITPSANPTQQQIDITYANNGTNDLFYMNNSTFRADYNSPTLLEAKNGNKIYPSDTNVYNFDSGDSVMIILYNYAQTGAHPMHMHGHNYYVLAEGSGTWDGTITRGSNPQRRDVQLLPAAISSTEPSYMVMQFELDNPGVWPLHCHIAWHVSTGLYVNIIESQTLIELEMDIPFIMAETCINWSVWTSSNIPDEIDSGL